MARPRKFDEAAVVDAARQQFWQHGYEGTSIADLCGVTGVASQSLYGAFGSKHELFIRTLEDYCTWRLDSLETEEQAADSPWAWLMAVVVFAGGGSLGLDRDGCYLSGSAVALARLDEEVQRTSQRTYGRMLDIFARALRRASKLGELQEGVDIECVALALLAAMQGIEFLAKSGMPVDQFAQAKAATVATLTRAYGAST